MSETAPVYNAESTGRDLPCPFCGSDRLEPNFWYIDDEEVGAWECAECKAGAPQRVWNTRHSPTLESTVGWHYPQSNADLENMPAPGQRVLCVYVKENGEHSDVIISTPVHEILGVMYNGKFLHRPLFKWHAMPGE